MVFSHHSLHPPVLLNADHQDTVRKSFLALPLVHISAVASIMEIKPETISIQIPLTTVSLGSNFDAYVAVSYRGSVGNSPNNLLVDSGNSVLIMPRWEDIEAISGWKSSYTVLLEDATEPWGCPAKIVRGPIQLLISGGKLLNIENCVFYACKADNPTDKDTPRTANFGVGCLTPWTTDSNIILQSPLSFLTSYPFVEFDYAPDPGLAAPSMNPAVAQDSFLNLYNSLPAGYTLLSIIPNIPWMALTPKALRIGISTTSWPGNGPTPPIAMIDTGGGPVFLSDPDGLIHATPWPDGVSCPLWVSKCTNCQCIDDDITLTLCDNASSISYKIDTSKMPVSVQGLTLVMCQDNYYMFGWRGMNTGGISTLFNYILVDYKNNRVGFKTK